MLKGLVAGSDMFSVCSTESSRPGRWSDSIALTNHPKGVRNLLGSLNYYHGFISNFATYAGALFELIDATFQDGTQLDHPENAFEALKKMLCEAPPLRLACNTMKTATLSIVGMHMRIRMRIEP